MILLRVDSRDEHGHIFGQIGDFAEESHFSDGVINTIEAVGGIDCTALSTTKIATSQSKLQYDEQELWSRVPHSLLGADPRDTLGQATAAKGGLQILSGTRDTRFISYFRADTGALDAFDNVRSAMTLAKSSCTVASRWYGNWSRLQAEEVMPQGNIVRSSHDYVILDWKVVNGETLFVIDAHLNRLLYMPRGVFNDAVSGLGCGAYMLSTQVINDRRTRTLTEYLIDSMKNLVLLLQAQLNFLKSAH